MAQRMQRRYVATTSDGSRRFYGYCPGWVRLFDAANTLNADLTITSEPVLAVGKSEPCLACNGTHIDMPPPWDPNA